MDKEWLISPTKIQHLCYVRVQVTGQIYLDVMRDIGAPWTANLSGGKLLDDTRRCFGTRIGQKLLVDNLHA